MDPCVGIAIGVAAVALVMIFGGSGSEKPASAPAPVAGDTHTWPKPNSKQQARLETGGEVVADGHSGDTAHIAGPRPQRAAVSSAAAAPGVVSGEQGLPETGATAGAPADGGAGNAKPEARGRGVGPGHAQPVEP